jgi:predicted NBD/HSP70 family sugar kinase
MYVLFDIGGTKTRVAASKDGINIDSPEVFATPELFEEGVEKLVFAIKKLSGSVKPIAIAGGIAGPFDQKTSALRGSPNLKEWVGKPLKAKLEASFGVPIYIENDSALCGLGEATYGAGKDERIVAYLTLSTGFGGARIVDGRIDEKSIGFEPGHQIIDASGALCPDAKGITLGHCISGAGILARTGKKPEEINDGAFWENTTKLLAYGLNNIIVLWSPDVIVLGGSVSRSINLRALSSELKETVKIFPSLPEIKHGELGDLNGLHGAMVYLQQRHGT